MGRLFARFFIKGHDDERFIFVVELVEQLFVEIVSERFKILFFGVHHYQQINMLALAKLH